MGKTEKQNNARVEAISEKGYIQLYLYVNEIDKVSIKVNDFGGSQKKRAKALTYKIFKEVQ